MGGTIGGSCLCGGVRFEVELPFRRANHCHCSLCRKHSGTFGLTQGRVPREQFRLLAIEALRAVEDPELGMDIVELGLLYDVEVAGPRAKIRYSLTSMGCPAGPLIQQSIEEVAAALPGIEDVETELTWDPPWTPE